MRKLKGVRQLAFGVWIPAILLLVALGGCGRAPGPGDFAGFPEDAILYTIQPGETLFSLAERHYGDRSLGWALATVNELPDPERVEAGTGVFIPREARILVSMSNDRRPARRPYNRGTYLLELGRDREAIRQLEIALSKAPQIITARYHLAVAYLRQGRLAEATGELEEIVRRRPLDKDFRYALGCAYLEGERYGQARKEFQQALRFDPTFAHARFGAALAAARMGKKREAAEDWREYLDQVEEGEWADRAREHLVDLYDQE